MNSMQRLHVLNFKIQSPLERGCLFLTSSHPFLHSSVPWVHRHMCMLTAAALSVMFCVYVVSGFLR